MHPARLSTLLTPALVTICLSGCATEPEPYARAFELRDIADSIGGPKALARPADSKRGLAGDYILENDQVRVAIVGGRHSMGPSMFGGTLIDADRQRVGAQWSRGNGNDRLAELFSTVNMNVIKAESVEHVFVVNDGSNGETAVVRAIASDEPFITLLGGLWAIVGAPRFNMATDYMLEPGKDYVRMRTTVWAAAKGGASELAGTEPPEAEVLTGSDDLDILGQALNNGLVFGDFYLQGGNINVFAPGLGFDEKTAVHLAELDGINTFQQPFALDFIAGTAPGVSYGLAGYDGPQFVPLFTSSQTAGFGAGVGPFPDGAEDEETPSGIYVPGAAYSYERVFVVGDGDVGSVLDGILQARIDHGDVLAADVGTLHGNVLTEGDLEPVSGALVLVFEPGAEFPYSQWTTDVSWDDNTPDGSFGGMLPVGDWELVVHEQGRETSERVPVTVASGGELNINLSARRSGIAEFRIVDEAGITVPGKVTVMPASGPAVRDPVLGDGFIAGDPEAVVFCPYGICEAMLPPGDYVAWGTRGPEYELGMQAFSVSATQSAWVDLQVQRSVDTEGWISADFHVHSQPSHDSGVSPADRVGTMASEQVEYFVATDHDVVSDFRPVVEDMGLEPWIRSAVGLEVTPVELGHYLAFPLVSDFVGDAGGAIDWMGLTPNQILSEMSALGGPEVEPVTVVAHPRDGILGYFDQFGFDPYQGTPGNLHADAGLIVITNPLLNPANFETDFDALELLNGKRFDFIRTPTAPELADFDPEDFDASDTYGMLTRTLEEQQDLEDGVYTLGFGRHGQIDDWFSLLNLGYRYTALGNSDTHGTTSIESGCPRNYVAVGTDDPAYVSDVEVAEAVKAGNVFTTTGPFLRFVADDEYTMGDEFTPAGGEVSFYIEVQSPTWFNVDRVELYRNGTLVEEWEIQVPNADVLNLTAEWTDTPDIDSWYVLIASGQDSLYPLFTPVEIPPVELQEVITGALSGVDAVSSLLTAAPPVPTSSPTFPYALTNPIFVDLAGDGFSPPGLPDWLTPPADPNEEE